MVQINALKHETWEWLVCAVETCVDAFDQFGVLNKC